MILPVSSWAFWAGMLSSAEEIHVNGPPLHKSMGLENLHYIYHNEKSGKYFGRVNNVTKSVEYTIEINVPIKKPPNPKQSKSGLKTLKVD